MNSWGTILLGWAITFGSIGAYAFWLMVRARQLGSELGIGGDVGNADGDNADFAGTERN
jgi:hypothetical protein